MALFGPIACFPRSHPTLFVPTTLFDRYEILFSSEVEGGRYAVSAMSTYSSASNVKANLADERFLQDSLHQSDHLANSGSTARFLEIFKPDRTYVSLAL